MKNWEFSKYNFGNWEFAFHIALRMNWEPVEDDDTFTITFPEEDFPLVEFIFDDFM